MEWLNEFLTDFLGGPDKVAYIVFLYAFVIAIGAALGKIKFFGVSLGVTFVLFVGIAMGHFGFSVNEEVLYFVQEFGLILFVFCIGLQVGPSFFSTFKKGGLNLNLLAIGVVVLNIIVALSLFFILGGKGGAIELPMLIGVLYGAVTNTPGLGAAQEVLTQQGYDGADIALGYACAYPLGVLGIIGSIIALRYIFKVDLKKEEKVLIAAREETLDKPTRVVIEVTNTEHDGLSIGKIRSELHTSFICSHISRDGVITMPKGKTEIRVGDEIFITCSKSDKDNLVKYFGVEAENQLLNIAKFDDSTQKDLVVKKIMITKANVNSKTIKDLHIRDAYSVTVTSVDRAGTELMPDPDLDLFIGDRLTVVGTSHNIAKIEMILGNSIKSLDHPNLITIFIGICVGMLFGSLSVKVADMPGALKLGLAGGPLVIAILVGRYGHLFKLVTYTTNSANLMLRETGLALFLASVGIKAGQNFISTVVDGDGLLFVGVGVVITVIPLLIIGVIGRVLFKVNYFKLIGLIAGSNTDPPALGYSTQISNTDAPAVAYSTVYPLSMFLRILSGQLILLLMAAFY